MCVGAPIYTNVLTDHEVNKGDSFSVSLNLERIGENFTYIWTKNGVQFRTNSNINVTVTSLFIASADCGDNGIYNVTATNQFGSDWLSFKLTVLCKLHCCIINHGVILTPTNTIIIGPPVFQAIGNATQINVNVGQSFTINCRVIESYPPNPRIILTVTPGNTSEDITASPMQNITSDKVGDYMYTCRADNTRDTTTLAFQVQVTAMCKSVCF